MVFVGQEFGMCLGIAVGMQVGKHEQGQLGPRQACLCWCSLQEFPGGNPHGLIWASSEHAASGPLDNVYSNSGSSKCSSKQSGGCIPFFKQASKSCCHFFLIQLVKDSHKPAQKAGKIDPSFQWESCQGHIGKSFLWQETLLQPFWKIQYAHWALWSQFISLPWAKYMAFSRTLFPHPIFYGKSLSLEH